MKEHFNGTKFINDKAISEQSKKCQDLNTSIDQSERCEMKSRYKNPYFNPSMNTSLNLEKYISSTKSDMKLLDEPSRNPSNLSKSERDTQNSLQLLLWIKILMLKIADSS